MLLDAGLDEMLWFCEYWGEKGKVPVGKNEEAETVCPILVEFCCAKLVKFEDECDECLTLTNEGGDARGGEEDIELSELLIGPFKGENMPN